MVAAMADHRFVFIGGMHRSGTTPLARCLASHPRVSGFGNTGVPADEGQHLQDVYPPDTVLGGPGLFGFHEPGHLTEDCELITDANRRRLFEQWAEHWDLDRPVLLEKTPANLIRSRFLAAMFPGCRFVFIQRHPVAASLATMKMSHVRNLPELVEHWVVCHRLFHEDVERLDDGSYVAMRYERFIEDPQAHVDRVFEALGLEPVPVADRVERGASTPYFQAYARQRRRWLTRGTMRRMIRRWESEVRELGYSLERVEELTPSPVFDP